MCKLQPMQSFKPYLWLKKNTDRYNAYFTISLPANYDVVGLQAATESGGIRTYEFQITSASHASQTVDSSTGNHNPATGITKLEIDVVDVTDPSNHVIKGKQSLGYQDSDDT